MRPWPVFQICTAAILLGLAGILLQRVVSKPEISADPETTSSTVSADDGGILTYISIEASEPVDLLEARWGVDPLQLVTISPETFEAEVSGSSESIFLKGRARLEKLPVAIRMEIETDGAPTTERIYWIRNTDFEVIHQPVGNISGGQ